VRRRRLLLATLAVLLLAGGLVWRYQSALLGMGVRWYLGRMAAGETREGTLEQRRTTVVRMHRLLLMSPPPDALVPELFTMLTLLGQRMASGAVPPAWAAYLYTSYYRNLVHDRPDGSPPRTLDEVRVALDQEVAFYAVRQRPDTQGLRFRDIRGPGDGYTADEIEQAAREGRELPLR